MGHRDRMARRCRSVTSQSTDTAFNPASMFGSGEKGYVFDASALPTATDAHIMSMLDSSGLGNHATQAMDVMRATKRVSGGIHSAEFDGAMSIYSLPTDILSGSTKLSLIMSVKLAAYPQGSTTEAGPPFGALGAEAGGGDVYWTNSHLYQGPGSDSRYDCGIMAENLAAWHLEEFRSAANDFELLINSVSRFTDVTNTVGIGANPTIGAGAGGLWHFKGHISRAIIINRNPVGAELTNARTWVAEGAGL